MRRRRLMVAAALSLGSVAGLWLGGFIWFVSGLPRAVADPDRKTDAIVVLTGGSLRISEGMRLLRAGRAGRLFISGVPRGIDAEQALQSAGETLGPWACCVFLGHTAGDTPGNARETVAWARTEGVRSLRLVTSAYHMPRSLLEFHAAGPEIALVPHPVFPPSVRQEEWWRWPGTADLLIGEYHKYLVTWVLIGLVGAPQ